MVTVVSFSSVVVRIVGVFTPGWMSSTATVCGELFSVIHGGVRRCVASGCRGKSATCSRPCMREDDSRDSIVAMVSITAVCYRGDIAQRGFDIDRLEELWMEGPLTMGLDTCEYRSRFVRCQ